MALSIARVRHYLQEFALEKLFIDELGWDRHAARLQCPGGRPDIHPEHDGRKTWSASLPVPARCSGEHP